MKENDEEFPKNYGLKQREKRIRMIIEKLKDDGLVDLDHFIARLSMNWSLSERKIKEYIKVLVDSGEAEYNQENNTLEWIGGKASL